MPLPLSQVWLCGGQLLHSPCSKIGHIARSQPYSFPAGRYQTEMHNYKRAVEVWMGDYKKYVYEYFPAMKVRNGLGDQSITPTQPNPILNAPFHPRPDMGLSLYGDKCIVHIVRQ